MDYDHLVDLRRAQDRPSRHQFFHYVFRDLRLNASQVVMVGDSFESDVLGANQVGIFGIWLNRGRDERVGPMHRTIRRLRMLPEVLESLFKRGSPCV